MRKLFCISILALVPLPALAVESMTQVKLESTYALGVAQYRLDHETKVTGWRVAKDWYFGRQRGADSGLTLVWQRKRDQVSFSKDGIRFTRRF